MFAAMTINANVLWVAVATLVAMAIGTLLRLTALSRADRDIARQRLDSLKTWWMVALVVIGAALLGRVATAILLAGVSVLALREFLRLTPRITAERRLLIIAYALIPLNYLWIMLNWPSVFIGFLPLVGLMLLSVASVAGSQISNVVRQVPRLYWGMMLAVYLPAYAALLFTLPASANPVAGPAGWFLFLVILTETNDIAQALVGRRIGMHRIAPQVSPHKTWEGLLGGMATSLLLAAVLAHHLTPFGYLEALLAGLLISITGFFGDFNLSLLKRHAGVKDAGRLLPGQGGVLDRINSLTFSAPSFYYFALLLERLTLEPAG